MDLKRKQDLAVAAVCAYVLVHLLCYTDRMPLFHEEPRRAIVAQEMLMSGDYIVPTMYQVPYCKKPPFHNWLITFTSAARGTVTGPSARLVSIAALLAAGLGVYGLLRRRRPDIAFPSFLMTVTNFVMACEYGNKVEPDMTLTALVTLAAVCYLAGPARPAWIALSALFTGAGILTKGMSPLFFYPGALALILAKREAWGKRAVYLLAHAALSLLLPAAWLWLYAKHGDIANLLGVASSEVSARADRSFGEFLGHLFTFPPELFLALVPWSVVVALAFRKNAEKDDVYRFCWWVALVAFVFFLLLPSGKNRLIMPAIPFMAVVGACHLDLAKRPPRWLRLAALGLMAALGLGFGGLLAFNGHWFQVLLMAFVVAAAILMMRRSLTCFGLGAAVALLTLFVYQHGVYFYRSTYRFDYRAAARQMVAEMAEDLPIVVDDKRYPKQIAFYLETETGRPVLSRTLEEPEAYYFVTVPESADRKTGWVLRRQVRDAPAGNEGEELP